MTACGASTGTPLPLPTCLNPPEPQDALAEIAKLSGDQHNIRQRVADLGEVRFQSLTPPKVCSPLYQGKGHLELRDEEVIDRGDITPVICIYRSLGDLHVLPRHRLPPFLCEAFGGSTGLVDVLG
jgi:hypothetical protein